MKCLCKRPIRYVVGVGHDIVYTESTGHYKNKTKLPQNTYIIIIQSKVNLEIVTSKTINIIETVIMQNFI